MKEYFVVYEAEGEKQTSYPFDNLNRAVNLARLLSKTYNCDADVLEHATFSQGVPE